MTDTVYQLPAVHDAPIQNRHDGLDIFDLILGTIQVVAIHYDQISEFAHYDRTPLLFGELQIGRPDCVCFQSLLTSDPLFGVHHLASHRLACDLDPEAQEWIVWIHGAV